MEHLNIFDLHDWGREENGLILIHKLMDFGMLPKEGSMFCNRKHSTPMTLRKDGSCFKWRCNHPINAKSKQKRKACGYMEYP